jgi:hypothetical protein
MAEKLPHLASGSLHFSYTTPWALPGQNFPTWVNFRNYFQALESGLFLRSPPCFGKPDRCAAHLEKNHAAQKERPTGTD